MSESKQATRRSGMGSHESANAQTTTWLTPPHILEALGDFDLDPCAHPKWLTARRLICLPEDGLEALWPKDNRVWLNPPYGRETEVWLHKLADHGRGTALIFARTETKAFIREVWGRATAVLFLHGRLFFHRADGTKATANAGAPSVLVAYGEEDAQILRRSGLDGTWLRIPRPETVDLNEGREDVQNEGVKR